MTYYKIYFSYFESSLSIGSNIYIPERLILGSATEVLRNLSERRFYLGSATKFNVGSSGTYENSKLLFSKAFTWLIDNY